MLEQWTAQYDLQTITETSPIYYGFVKQVEIIGEATYMLTKEFRDAHSEIQWDPIENMRHVLVHGYYAINPKILCYVIQNDLPALKPYIEKYIAEENADNTKL